jgi:ABC-type proline/glycine betaine transport system ATPase subunit
VSHLVVVGATLLAMPTAHPRYTVTDTGQTAELLDLAAEAWPEVTDRRQLLLRLTEVGARALQAELADERSRRERQRVGLQRAAALVDVDELLGDGAWR